MLKFHCSKQPNACLFIDFDITLEPGDDDGETALSCAVVCCAPNVRIVLLLRGEYASYSQEQCLSHMKKFGAPSALVDRVSDCLRISDLLSPFSLICAYISTKNVKHVACIAIVKDAERYGPDFSMARCSMISVESGIFDDTQAKWLSGMLWKQSDKHLGDGWLFREKRVDDLITNAVKSACAEANEEEEGEDDLFALLEAPSPEEVKAVNELIFSKQSPEQKEIVPPAKEEIKPTDSHPPIDVCLFVDFEIALERRDIDGKTDLLRAIEWLAPNAVIVLLVSGEYGKYGLDQCQAHMKQADVPDGLIERVRDRLRIPKGFGTYNRICAHIIGKDIEDVACIAIVRNLKQFGPFDVPTRTSLLCVASGLYESTDDMTLTAMIKQRQKHLGREWLTRNSTLEDLRASVDETQESFENTLAKLFADPHEDLTFGEQTPEVEGHLSPVEEARVPMPSMYPTPPLEWANEPPLKLRSPWLGMEDIRPEMMSRHWMVVGETGSGKTKSVVLPLLDSLINYQINA